MIRQAITVSLMLASCGVFAVGGGSDDWVGEYSYFESAGTTVGGSPIMMNIKLTIKNDDPKSKCILEASGYQTDETLYCTASATNNTLTLFFKSFDTGSTTNEFDVEPYKAGEKLFTLERKSISGKQDKFIPTWASYLPFGDGEAKAGEYFEKSPGTK